MTHYLEFVDDTSAKFWMIKLLGNSHTVTYGKIGSEGRASTKEFDSAEEAQKSAAKLIASKKKKGYTASARTDAKPAAQLTNDEAVEKYGLADRYVGNIRFAKVIVFEGDVEIYGDVNKNTVESLFFDGEREPTDELVIIDGNLTVHGSLDLTEYYPCLLVLGDLHCDFVTSVNSYKEVTGDAYITTAFIGNYNHGQMVVEGTTHVPLILNSDHGCTMTPNPKTVCINYFSYHDDFFKYDYYVDELKNLFPDEFFELFDEDDDEDFDFEWWSLAATLKSGASPFLEGAAPDLLSAEEIRAIASGDAPAGEAPASNPKPTTMSPAEAKEAFEAFRAEPALTFLSMCGDATVYRGNVTSDVSDILDLALTLGEQGTPIVIDGDLTLTADSVEWGSESECNLLLVTGDLRVNHLLMSEVGDITVQGDLHAKTLVGMYGDNGGSLNVAGDAQVEVLVATTYFCFGFGGNVQTKHIIGDGTYATDFTDDYISTESTNLFVPEMIEGGEFSAWQLFEARVAGKEVFVNNGKVREGAYEQEW